MAEKEVVQNMEIFNPEADQKAFEEGFEESIKIDEGQKPIEKVEVKPDKVEIKPEEKKDQPLKKDEGAIDYKLLYEQGQLKFKEIEDRAGKAETRIKELEKPPVQKVEMVVDTKLDVDDPLIKAFIDEMGEDFIKPLELFVKKHGKAMADAMMQPYMEKFKKLDLLDKVPAIEQRLTAEEESKVNEHFEKIQGVHKDVIELMKSGEIDKWVEGLSYKEALEKKRIMEKGKTQEVIDFLTEFKEKTGKIVPSKGNGKDDKGKESSITDLEVKPAGPSKEKVQSATAVKTGGFILPKGKAAADDFVGAFDEAVAEDQLVTK